MEFFHQRHFDEAKEPLLGELRAHADQHEKLSHKMQTQLTAALHAQFEQQMHTSNAVMQDTIISSCKAIIKEELQAAMRDQYNSLPDRLINQMRRSGAITPMNHPSAMMNTAGAGNLLSNTGSPASASSSASAAQPPLMDVQQQISSFIQKGQLNSAFQVALCAADLALLTNLCESVNPSQVGTLYFIFHDTQYTNVCVFICIRFSKTSISNKINTYS